MSDENDLLKIENNPQTVARKPKRIGRRFNNIPTVLVVLFFGFVVAIVAYTLISRGNRRNQQEETPKGGASAMDYAKELILSNRGVIEPKREESPSEPAPAPAPIVIEKLVRLPEVKPEPLPVKAAPPPPPPAPMPEPKVDPEVARLRQRRLQLAELAIAGRIDVQSVNATNTARVAAGTLPDTAASTGGPHAASPASRGGQVAMMDEFSGDSSRWKPMGNVEVPTKYMLITGTVIPATMITGLNSDLKGQIIAQVSQNVYDTATGMHLLIPQGARLVGEYLSEVQYGQSRVFAAWQRLIFPDGKTLDLGAMPSSTGAGYSGLKDRVNNHYFRIFGSALMMSGVIAGIDKATDNSNSNNESKSMGDSMSQALGNTFGNVVVEMMRKNMAIAPTIEIRPGFRLNVMLTRDVEFEGRYTAFDYIKR